MRIEFPDIAREAFLWPQSLLRVGSAADNDLVLEASQAAAHHVRIWQDRRGLVLHVLPQCQRIYVNARPVRERALLRAGDILSIGHCRLLLCSDETAGPDEGVLQDNYAVSLRAVAGPLSGRVLTIGDRLVLGGTAGSYPLDLPQGDTAVITLGWQQSRLWVEVEQASHYHVLRINGVATTRSLLRAGDQLGLAHHRFVVNAPPRGPARVLAAELTQNKALAAKATKPHSSGETWWLIFTAALLALAIAASFLLHA